MSSDNGAPRGLGSATSRKRKRLYLVLGGLALLGVAAALVLNAFEDSLLFFHSPSDVQAKAVAPEQRFRIGGLVEPGSVERGPTAKFTVTDGAAKVDIQFQGILPDLFREGQGIVALGALNENGVFIASEVLAKHDENYMPPEVAEALKKSGRWQEGEPAPSPNSGGY